MSSMYFCTNCGDAGVLEVTDGQIKTLALCYCSQGKKQPWALPTIPIVGWKHDRLRWQDYKPRSEGERNEKIEWHRERVKTAQKFWSEQEQA